MLMSHFLLLLSHQSQAPHTAPLAPDPNQSVFPQYDAVRIDRVVQHPRA